MGPDSVLPADERPEGESTPQPSTVLVNADPELRDILKGGPNKYLTTRQKVERYLSWFLLTAVTVLSVGYFSNRTTANAARDASDKANTALVKAALGVQASCSFWHDLALITFTAPAGFELAADGYISYAGLGCAATSGELPAPSAGVAAAILARKH